MDAREKLMQILDKPVFPEGKDCLEAVTDYLLENDVVPVTHAHWHKNNSGYYRCSKCSWLALEVETGCLVNRHYEQELTKYCPYCGAKMDGDTDD